MRWFNSTTDSVDMNLRKLWERVKDRGAWRTAVHGVAKSQIGLSNSTARNKKSEEKQLWEENKMCFCMKTIQGLKDFFFKEKRE